MTAINLSLSAEGLLPPTARRLVSEKTGVVRRIERVRLDARDDPSVFVSQATEADVSVLADSTVRSLESGGKALSQEESLLGAAGETVERLCFYDPLVEGARRASYASLRERGAATPAFRYLDVYGPSQRERDDRLDPFDRHTDLWWYPGRDLLTGDRVHVPAQRVVAAEDPDAPRHFLTNTTGCACGSSPEQAIVGAIHEAVERDAFVRAWCRQEAPPSVDLSGVPAVEKLYRDEFENASVEFRPLAFPSEHEFTTAGCAVVASGDRTPKFALTAGAASKASEALTDALVEAAQVWQTLKRRMAEDPTRTAGELRDIRDGFTHYARSENFADVSAFLDGGTTRLTDDDPEQSGYERCLRSMADAGYTPIAVDLTRPEAAEIGWHVVAVFVPELVPLTPPSLLPRDHPALAEVTVTDKPHPFP